MQPYFFPYIGYFQLINSVNKFIFYDDVNFIKGGWINRNRILVNNFPSYINVEMKGASSFRKIKEVEVNTNYIWRKKMLSTIFLNYKHAPNHSAVFSLIENVMNNDYKYLNDYIKNSIIATCNYLNIDTEIIESSLVYQNSELNGKERVLSICEKEKACNYINLIGGKELYKKEDFLKRNIELSFLQTQFKAYKQFNNEYVAGLSIVDVMMFNSKEEIKELLDQYELI